MDPFMYIVCAPLALASVHPLHTRFPHLVNIEVLSGQSTSKEKKTEICKISWCTRNIVQTEEQLSHHYKIRYVKWSEAV